MTRPDSPAPQRGAAATVLLVVFILIIAAVIAGAWYLRPRFEPDPPVVTF